MPYYYPVRKMSDTVERSRIAANLLKLREQLNRDIPPKTDAGSMLIATWNIRKFNDKRREESLHYIAEIISRFDLVAVQEVSADMAGLERLMKLLDLQWDYLVTDTTDGSAGNSERMAILYDRSKVTFRKMAGELVLAQDNLIGEDKLQFARTPYTVAFQSGWFKFVLTTVHIFFGTATKKDKEKRRLEIAKITSVLGNRVKKEDMTYILLGDFNIPDTQDVMMQALTNNGFYVPDDIKAHPTDLGQVSHYDQIAFNTKLGPGMTIFSERGKTAGAFNFTESVYGVDDWKTYLPYFAEQAAGKTEDEIKTYFRKTWRTFEMSDHLPLWVELKTDFSDQYLRNIVNN